MKYWILAVTLVLSTLSPLQAAQSIAEKKQAIERGGGDLDIEVNERIRAVNDDLSAERSYLRELYSEAQELFQSGADEESYRELRDRIVQQRQELREIEVEWQQRATKDRDEEYALWYQPETTIGQLVVDYGDPKFVYLLPPEIASLKLSVSSSLPVPMESWGEMLDLVLTYKGVGVRQLNSYLKQLFIASEDSSGLSHVTDSRQQLEVIPPASRVCYVLKPHSTEVNSTFHFLNRFANDNTTSIQLAGRQIFIVGTPVTVKELLKLHDFIDTGPGSREFRLLSVNKMSAEEMASILRTVFQSDGAGQIEEEGLHALEGVAQDPSGLVIMPLTNLTHSLFLMGTRDDIDQAVTIAQEIEDQVGDVKQKTMYWYSVKHSDPQELAEVLERVYAMMSSEAIENLDEPGAVPEAVQETIVEAPIQGEYLRGVEPQLRVQPGLVDPGAPRVEQPPKDLHNFIVEPKTGAIIMVVTKRFLPKLKELLRKLDVPKQMVQIEVLLVEQRATLAHEFGMNLLRFGGCAENTRAGCMSWSDTETNSANKGILEFLLQRERIGDFPAFDLGLKFLLSQENVIINSAPTVTTVNQTPAVIHVVEEISLNTGIVELDTTNNTTVKDAYTRAQYGVTVAVTPTIHIVEGEYEDEEGFDYITLEATINFDETISDSEDRPNVIRREVKNTVRVADGESLIVGGLRNKRSTDGGDHVPYLCEIPGLGKLFGTNSQTDTSTEMFVFITPTIVSACDPEASAIRRCVQCRRPGEGPTYLKLVSEAKAMQKLRLREQGMRQLLGQSDEILNQEALPYDGR